MQRCSKSQSLAHKRRVSEAEHTFIMALSLAHAACSGFFLDDCYAPAAGLCSRVEHELLHSTTIGTHEQESAGMQAPAAAMQSSLLASHQPSKLPSQEFLRRSINNSTTSSTDKRWMHCSPVDPVAKLVSPAHYHPAQRSL